MTSRSGRKGKGYEREIVNFCREQGIEAKRAWGSNGAAIGEHEEVDLQVKYKTPIYTNIEMLPIDNVVKLIPAVLNLQAKRYKRFLQRKSAQPLHQLIALTEHVDGVVWREDGEESYITMRFNDFVKRFLI